MNPNAKKSLEEWRRTGVKKVVKTPYEKLREKPSLKRAITAKCCDCMGWEEGEPMPHGLKRSVMQCTSVQCPLYDFRPWKPRGGEDADQTLK